MPLALFAHSLLMPLLCRPSATGGADPWRRAAPLLGWGWFLFTLPLLALHPATPLTDYEHRHWSIAHGLPHATVRAVQQTPDGYLWAATEYGLARFNGERFFAFTPKNQEALMRPFLTVLGLGPAGALWAGSEGGGLIAYHQGAFRRWGAEDGLSGHAVRAMASHAPNARWILSESSLHLWTTGALETIAIRGLSTNTVFWSLLEDQQGNLWLGTDRGLYGPINPQAPQALPVSSLSSRVVFALTQSPSGQLYAGTDAGLYLVQTNGGRAEAQFFAPLGPVRIRAVHVDRHGTVWIGATTGLRRLREGSLVKEEEIPSLRNASVFAFHEDREANFWIGAGNGLHCLQDRAFLTLSAKDGLDDEEVVTITEIALDSFLLGTSRGEVYAWEKGGLQRRPELQRPAAITAITQDSRRRLWIGSRRDGLVCAESGRTTRYGVNQGLRSPNVFAIVEDPMGSLWVGTEKGLHRQQGQEFAAVDLPVPPGTPPPVIRSLYIARDQSLWVGTQNGVFRLTQETTNYYNEARGFPAKLVYHITEDKKGRLWLGTAQGAVSYWDGQWRLYKPTDGFDTWHVFWLALDEQGFAWFATPWTIFRTETAALLAYWRGEKTEPPTPLMFTQSDGLLAMECLGGRQSAGCQTSDGRLIFLTRRGLAIARPADLAPSFQPPRVVIERIQVNGQDYPIAPLLELPPGSRILEIDFAGLSFRQPEKVQHSYRLMGVDDNWVMAYQRRTATYAHLAPGRYEFRVTADNGYGAWSVAGAGVELIIRPYFYQTPWFYAGVMGLAAAGIYGGYRWRVRLLKKRNAWLSSRLSERTHEVEQLLAERFRLEQAALIRQQQEAISQMAAGIAHHLNNQLQAIQSSAALLQEEWRNPQELRSIIQYLDEAIGKSARIVEQLLTYGQRHWLNIQPLRLPQFLPSLLARYPADRVQVNWRGDIPPVRADANILEQAFTAVLENALQASPPGAPVQVHIQAVQCPPPSEHASPAPTAPPAEQTFVQIQIKDQGPGLSAMAQAHLFEPFFTTKDVGQGTGLGLAAAYGGLKQIGGWIEIFNAPEGGCTANLFLPVMPNTP